MSGANGGDECGEVTSGDGCSVAEADGVRGR